MDSLDSRIFVIKEYFDLNSNGFILTIIGTIIFAVAIILIIFSVNHWKNKRKLSVIMIIISLILLIPSIYIILNVSENNQKYSKTIYKVIVNDMTEDEIKKDYKIISDDCDGEGYIIYEITKKQ